MGRSVEDMALLSPACLSSGESGQCLPFPRCVARLPRGVHLLPAGTNGFHSSDSLTWATDATGAGTTMSSGRCGVDASSFRPAQESGCSKMCMRWHL